MACSRLMCVQLLVQPKLVTTTYRITGLHYIYECSSSGAAYICKIYLENHRVTLHLWVSNLVNSQCLLTVPTQSLYYTSLMGVPPYLQPMLVTSFYRITRWHYTYECPTLSAPYVGWLYLQNQFVTLHLWVSSFKCMLCLIGLLTESLS